MSNDDSQVSRSESNTISDTNKKADQLTDLPSLFI